MPTFGKLNEILFNSEETWVTKSLFKYIAIELHKYKAINLNNATNTFVYFCWHIPSYLNIITKKRSAIYCYHEFDLL